MVPGFDLPIPARISSMGYTTLHPTESWQAVRHGLESPEAFVVHPDYYIITRVAPAP